MRRVAFLLVTTMLAGCVSEGPSEDPSPGDDAAPPALAFRPFIDLGSVARPGAFGTSCQDSAEDGDCGLGEPQVEVDGAGTIYVSGVCCLTVPPPVYVSRDGGATFEDLATQTQVREQFGIEGDFAIDETGRVYFADIEFAGTFQVTAWEPDGTFIHHTKWPAVPIVDRDWIRAEGDGILYYVYNTGTTTNVYKSTDRGQTWSPAPIYTTEYGLGNAAIWPGQELCVVGGSEGGMRLADCSTDGGTTWETETTGAVSGGNFPVPVFDEDGTLFVTTNADETIGYAYRTDDGWKVGPDLTEGGHHRMPWAAASADGVLAVAWYGTDDADIGAGTRWLLHTALITDADTDAPQVEVVVADEEPVFVGALDRDLLDFLQIDFGPDGAVHVAYSKQRPEQGPDQNEEQLMYVRSEPMPDLARTDFWWGP